MADDNAAAEQRDEDVDGDDGVVVRDRESAGFEKSSQTQPHVAATPGDPPQLKLKATCGNLQQETLDMEVRMSDGHSQSQGVKMATPHTHTLQVARDELNYCLNSAVLVN